MNGKMHTVVTFQESGATVWARSVEAEVIHSGYVLSSGNMLLKRHTAPQHSSKGISKVNLRIWNRQAQGVNLIPWCSDNEDLLKQQKMRQLRDDLKVIHSQV